MIAPAQTLPRWLPAALFIGALGAALWRAPDPAAPAFAPPPAAKPSTLPAFFSATMLPATGQPGEVSLTLLPDGRVAAAWSAEDDQTPDERSIRYSIHGQTGWSKPLVIASRASTAGATFANENAIGNPLLHAEGGWLHLWYTSRGGWAGRSIRHSVSTNGGNSWTKATSVQTAPLASATLLRSPPVMLADGGLGLPISSHLLTRHGEYLRLAPTGEILDKQRLAQPEPGLQPAMVVIDGRRGLALLRDAGPEPGRVRVAGTDNGALSWQAEAALPLANPNTPLALLRLQSGRLLLAGNPQSGRAALGLWLSSDAGKTWQASHVLENAADGAAEFAEPSLLLDHAGRIHLAYTWRRQGIKYLSFSEAWLDGGQS